MESRSNERLGISRMELEGAGLSVFTDQYGEVYCTLPGQIGSVKFGTRQVAICIYQWLRKNKKEASWEAIKNFMRELEGEAIYSPDHSTLEVRTAYDENDLWYHLNKTQAVKIVGGSWEVKNYAPTIFRTFSHQKDQVVPTAGDPKKILEFVNLPRNEDGGLSHNQILFLVWLITAFIPGFPHAILVLHGPQGAAKTTAFRFAKSLIDPSQISSMGFPGKEQELIQVAYHHYFLPLDNLTKVSSSFSDLLSRICSGEGFSKRALFTDDSDVVYSFRRILGLNGISITPDKADLLDRCLLLGMERVRGFKTEEELVAEFEKAKPGILGGIFDVVAKARELLPKMPSYDFRLADFVKYGAAAAEALGIGKEAFIDAYTANIAKQNQEALGASVIGEVVVDMAAALENCGEWVGSSTELLRELNLIAENKGINTKSYPWPQNPRWLKRRVDEVRTNVDLAGVYLKWGEPRAKLITVRLKSVGDVVSQDTAEEPTKHVDDPTADIPDIFGSR